MKCGNLLILILVNASLIANVFQAEAQVFSDVSLLIFERISSNGTEEDNFTNKSLCNLQITRKKGTDNLFILTYTDKSAFIKIVITDYIFLRNPAIFLLDADHDKKPDILLEGIDSNGAITTKIYRNDGKMNLVEFLPPMDMLWRTDSRWKNFAVDTILVTKNLSDYQLTGYHKVKPIP